MTIEELARITLKEYLIYDTEIDTIIEQAKTNEKMESMKGRWQDLISDYPPILRNVFIYSLKTIAIDWLTENHPKWFQIDLLKKG